MSPNGSTRTSFSINDGVLLTASNVNSHGFKFGGPTGQELVGAVTLGGSTSSGAAGYFSFAFGAKK